MLLHRALLNLGGWGRACMNEGIGCTCVAVHVKKLGANHEDMGRVGKAMWLGRAIRSLKSRQRICEEFPDGANGLHDCIFNGALL